MSEFFLFITGITFSFFCAFLKQAYVNSQYTNVFTLILDVLVSGFAGLIIACVLSEYFHSPLAFIGLCGAGGLGGAQALQYLMTKKVATKVVLDGEEPDEDIEFNITDNSTDVNGLVNEIINDKVEENNQLYTHSDEHDEGFAIQLDNSETKIKVIK